jgi:glycerophosphoryl diester phosphodiesterase
MSDDPRPRPRVIAHRGASDAVAEHTLAAYVRAIDEGADGLEADVRLTADGHLVCVHDRKVDRTSNGRGVLSTLELDELRALDFGSWRDRDDDTERPDQLDADNYTVLTLERLLELVVDTSRPLEVAIETKHPTRFAGMVERRLVDVLNRFDLAGPSSTQKASVRVMSFSEVALRRARRLAPELPLVLLMERVPVSYRRGTLPRGVGIAGPSIEVLRSHPRYPQRVRSQGHQVYVWTVDEPLDVELAVTRGVDAIITNRPRHVLAQLRDLSDPQPSEPVTSTEP